MYKRILVPIDGSDTGQRGLKEAITLAVEQKAALCLVHVTSDYPLMGQMVGAIDVSEYRDGLHQYGLSVLENAKALARSAGLEVETQLLDLNGGRVADAIVRAARSASCDLIDRHRHARAARHRPRPSGQRRRERLAHEPGARAARPRSGRRELIHPAS